jgi:hypothetical protein
LSKSKPPPPKKQQEHKEKHKKNPKYFQNTGEGKE